MVVFQRYRWLDIKKPHNDTRGGRALLHALALPRPRPHRLNVCHPSSDATPSFGAIFTLGRVINACDLLNLGCPESVGAPQWVTGNLLLSGACWVFSWRSPLNIYLSPQRRALLLLVAFINVPNVFACLSSGCPTENWLFCPIREQVLPSLTFYDADSRSVTRLLRKLSGNLRREFPEGSWRNCTTGSFIWGSCRAETMLRLSVMTDEWNLQTSCRCRVKVDNYKFSLSDTMKGENCCVC